MAGGSYVPNLEDKSSPYYYGPDSEYVPRPSRPKVRPPRPEFDLDENGLPVMVKPGRKSGKGIYGSLPRKAQVVTQYPDGVSTGVGGGNAGQAQSLDPNAAGYIAPTPKPPVDPLPKPP